MTLESATTRAPRAIQVYRLHVEQRMPHKEISAQLGIEISNVYKYIKRAKWFLAAPEPEERERQDCKKYLGMRTATRCHCGLMFPHECLKPLWRIAAERQGESAGTF